MNDPAVRVLLVLASVVIVLAGVKQAAPLLVPFLLALFIAIICAPPMFWLQRRGLPQAVAVLAVVLVVFGGALAVGALVGGAVNDFVNGLPLYQQRMREETLGLLQWLNGLGLQLDAKQLVTTFDPSAAMGLAGRTLSGFGNVLTNGFLIMMTVIFLLFEASSFPRRMVALSSDPEGRLRSLTAMADSVQRYLEIKALVSLATGLAVALFLALIEVDFPLVWGLLAFLLNFVPNIGSVVAAVPAVMLAFLQFGVGTALGVGLFYVVVNVLVGNVLEPRLMGKRLGLSTLVVFLSLVFWGWLLGPVGMLLSVPLTIVVKIVLDETDSTQWLGGLLGNR